MPQGIICHPLGNASRHHSPPAGLCLKASFAPPLRYASRHHPPRWVMPQGIIRPPPEVCLKASFALNGLSDSLDATEAGHLPLTYHPAPSDAQPPVETPMELYKRQERETTGPDAFLGPHGVPANVVDCDLWTLILPQPPPTRGFTPL